LTEVLPPRHVPLGTESEDRAFWGRWGKLVTLKPAIQHWESEMALLTWALIFAVIALVAGVFGFGGVASAAAGVARILFFIAIVVFLIFLIMALL
jgi:uncharacterized membrane protein YtjA (UPF0391 family)